MRCSCGCCGTYMVHSESERLGCVCPQCGARCSACLGTDTVMDRDALKNLANVPWMFKEHFDAPIEPEEEHEEEFD